MKEVYSSEIVPLFKEKGVSEKCECCGKELWIVHNNFSAILHQVSEEGTGFFSFPVVAMVCQNCGHLRLFSRQTLGIKDEEGS